MKYDVPFIANPEDECVPATIGMIIGYFEPEAKLTMPELHELCGYVKGMGAWQTKHMLEMAKRGYQLKWIEDFDWQAFINDPEAYLRSIISDPEALEYQISKTDLPLEAQRMRDYLASGLTFEKRKGTVDDIKTFLNDGWLVRLEVNASPLRPEKGYVGHSLLIIGYDEQGVVTHNPDGPSHNTPNLHITWKLLDQAWREFGGSYSLYAFKK
jgi:hypothetical protein